jgi:hypothetical protein
MRTVENIIIFTAHCCQNLRHNFELYVYLRTVRNSSVGIATHYGMDRPGIEYRLDRPWGPNQPLLELVSGPFPWSKEAGAWR